MPADSPWKTMREAGQRVGRGERFMRREAHSGRLRAASIGGRKQLLTKDDWIDAWVLESATPVVMLRRRGA